MSQQRVTIGLAALLVGALAVGAFFLLREPDPVAPPTDVGGRSAPAPIEKAKPADPGAIKPSDTLKPIRNEAFNPALDARTGRDQLYIGGTVVDAAGNGVPNATVELVYDASAVIARAQEADLRGTVVTVPDGRFLFSAETCPACGFSFTERYVIRVIHPDFAVERVNGVELRDPRSSNLTILMSQGPNRVVGSIRDLNGAPLAGAEVRVYDLNVASTDPDGVVERSGTSGSDGGYTVSNLKPGLKKIWVVRSGYASTGRPTQNLDAAKPEIRADFTLRQGREITGVVLGQDTGLGLANAYVTLKPTRFGPPASAQGGLSPAEVSEMKRRIESGEDPAVVKAAMNSVAAAKGDIQRDRSAAVPRGREGGAAKGADRAEAMKRRAEMERKRRESGGAGEAADVAAEEEKDDVAVKQKEEQIRQQELAAQHANLQLTTITFRTESDGRFKAAGLEEGQYQITVTAAGYAPPPIQSADTDAQGVTFNLVPNARIVGQCLDDETGLPLPSFTVGLGTSFDQNSVPYHMRRSFGPPKWKDGTFEYVDVRPGTYSLFAEAPGYAGGRSEQVTVGQGDRRDGVVIRLVKGATVLGRVVDAQGKPVVDAVVTLDSAASADPANVFAQLFNGQLRRDKKEARTQADGSYKVPNVLDGKYALKVRHPSFGPFDDPTPFEVPKGGEAQRPDVVLARGGSIRGRVLSDGVADSQAMVTVAPAAGNAFGQRQAQTDSDGRYEVTGLTPGEYRVICAQRKGQMDLGTLLGLAAMNAQGRAGAPPAGIAQVKVVTIVEGQTLDVDL